MANKKEQPVCHISIDSPEVMNEAPKQRSIIQAIQTAQAPDGMTTKIIAIDGLGGAGKSSFAEQLSHQLGNAPILHTDDFASWENPLNWWPRLLRQVLEPLSHNERARYQRYDWDTKRLAEWHEIQPTEYLLLEGVSSSREAFRPYVALSIWIETLRQERLRRGLQRDGEAARPQWEEWMACEDEYIEREHPEQKADLVFNGTQPYDLSVFFRQIELVSSSDSTLEEQTNEIEEP